MCVIIYKPAGVELPSKELLTRAQRINPHGCGLCSPTVTYKGLSFGSFLKNLNKVPKEEPLLIHFRFATQGSVRKGNCHPFYDEDTKTYFMHNGVLSGFLPHKDMTDSEQCFRWIFVPYLKKHGLESEKTKEEIKYQIGFSKFAFMQGDKVTLFGDFIYRDGLYFSNLRFI